MIVFVEAGTITPEELERLRRYFRRTYNGVVILVNSVDSVKVVREAE